MPPMVAPSPARSFTRTWPPLPTSGASTTRWCGNAKTGSGLPAPKGPARSTRGEERGLRAGRGQRCVDRRADRRACAVADRLARGARRAKPRRSVEVAAAGIVSAGRHGVAAALDGEPGLDGGAHGAAEIDPGTERPEPVAVPSGLRANAKAGRPKRSFRRAATRPTMPGCHSAERGHDERARPGSPSSSAQGLRLGVLDRRLLDRLALAVEAVELGGEARGECGSSRQEQPRSQRRVADPPAGIDPRPERDSRDASIRARPRGRRRRAAPRARPGRRDAHHREPLAHEGAVEAGERHHVRDGGERHEVEAREEVGLGPAGPEAARAQDPVERHQGQEHDARRAEMPEAGEVVLPVRIDDRQRVGKILGRLVVVEHDGVEAEAPGLGERLVARRAAIDRHQQVRRPGPGRLRIASTFGP